MSVSPIVLAYSGGLDTSFCVPWLSEKCRRPVVTLTVNTGGIDSGQAESLQRRAWRWAPSGICWWKRARSSSTK